MTALPKHVKLVEVGPRDGLQNEKSNVPTATKVAFINMLSETGLNTIEVTSFVSAKWIPQLSDHKEVYETITRKKGIHYPVLVPNKSGFEAAMKAGVKEIAVFTTPSELFSQKNTNCSVAESLARITEVVALARVNDIAVRGYLSCVLGCPYEGEMTPEKVAKLAASLWELGCQEISLGDTIGVGTPLKTISMLSAVSEHIPKDKLAVHFHDTYGQALANIYAALMQGIAIIDTSVAGLGGCPYAHGAAGNVATEDVLYLLNGLNIETGVDLTKIMAASTFITNALQIKPQSKAHIAMLPLPAQTVNPRH